MSHISPERYMVSSFDTGKHIPPGKYTAWERNVIDEYKTLSNEEIVARVAAKRLPFAILMTNIAIDYNLGACMRVANCLGGQLFYYGKKKFDKRSATGVWNYTPIKHLASLAEVKQLKEEYSFVALEQANNSTPLHQFDWTTNKKKTLIIVGEEALGLQETPEIFDIADRCVEIRQFGSVRSMNAATSVAIAVYDFIYKGGYFG